MACWDRRALPPRFMRRVSPSCSSIYNSPPLNSQITLPFDLHLTPAPPGAEIGSRIRERRRDEVGRQAYEKLRCAAVAALNHEVMADRGFNSTGAGSSR